MLIVLTTLPEIEAAADLAEKLVEAKLAACVQILPPMTSVYVWDGKIQKESEHLLLIKTLPEKYAEVEKFISEHHSYDLPEIVAVDAANVSPEYRKWLGESLI